MVAVVEDNGSPRAVAAHQQQMISGGSFDDQQMHTKSFRCDALFQPHNKRCDAARLYQARGRQITVWVLPTAHIESVAVQIYILRYCYTASTRSKCLQWIRSIHSS